MSFELKATHLLSYSTGSRQGTYHINWQDRWLPDVPEQRLDRHRNHLGQIFGDECTHTKWRGLREYVNQLLLTFFIPLNLSRLSNLYRSSSKRSWTDRNWRRASPNQFKTNCLELIFPQPDRTRNIFLPKLYAVWAIWDSVISQLVLSLIFIQILTSCVPMSVPLIYRKA